MFVNLCIQNLQENFEAKNIIGLYNHNDEYFPILPLSVFECNSPLTYITE